MAKKEQEQQSVEWFTTMVRSMGNFSKNTKALKDSGFGKLTTDLELGQYYFFVYDAKLKDKLPQWDACPLALPIESYSDGFLGLNLHYLNYGARIALHNKLLDFNSSPALTESSRISARYDLMKGVARYKAFEPCIHKYLFSHIQSRFLEIAPKYWMTALNLPVQRWRGNGSPY